MAAATCVDCGKKLTVWNRSTLSLNKCTDCASGRSPSRLAEFFARPETSEENIQKYPLTSAVGKLLVMALIIAALVVLGGLAGYGSGGMTRGFWYSLIAMMISGALARRLFYSSLTHPLDKKRWSNYGAPYVLVFALSWLIGFMGFMPTRSPFFVSPTHVVFGPLILPVAGFIALVGLLAAVLGFAAGMVGLAAMDRRDKTELIGKYRQWQKSGQTQK
jgi:hypothetical protein